MVPLNIKQEKEILPSFSCTRLWHPGSGLSNYAVCVVLGVGQLPQCDRPSHLTPCQSGNAFFLVFQTPSSKAEIT